MGSSVCFVLLSFSWYSGAPCRYFGPKWGPCLKTFHFVQVFIGVWEGTSCEIVCENHQCSLGFNWYFACADDGKLDSKSTKIQLVLCRVSATFPPNPGTVVAEVSINHWYVYIFCYFFAEFTAICMKNTSEVIRGVAKTRMDTFWKSSETPT